ncbi:MAG: NADH:flavin oxidoreductase, partial [Deltaproteobacteria bacterium]|nr:NADH:flavin oxidoreductase [Deltaproteobacteria bacterium]
MNTGKLFETTQINGMTLANRFVRSATWEGMASDEGTVTPDLVNLNAELARGGVGLIISSHAYVSRAGQAGPWQ